jgi:phosphoribosyl-ATP pyrophosphohydrolase/phosphoribosyl-AMP cyclohydrolase
MIDISSLRFDENGLVPAIVVHSESQAVLMLAYMNAESLKISIEERKTCFWSRSRKELWRKGETSGNVQHIDSIKTDCDMDALLITVKSNGPACHTGAKSCFDQDADDMCANKSKQFSIDLLHDIVEDRRKNRVPGSYTTYLFEKGIDKILKKIGEEATEVIIAAKNDDKKETVFELADLIYHSLVLISEMGITLDDIRNELASRHANASADRT